MSEDTKPAAPAAPLKAAQDHVEAAKAHVEAAVDAVQAHMDAVQQHLQAAQAHVESHVEAIPAELEAAVHKPSLLNKVAVGVILALIVAAVTKAFGLW